MSNSDDRLTQLVEKGTSILNDPVDIQKFADSGGKDEIKKLDEWHTQINDLLNEVTEHYSGNKEDRT